MSAHTKTPTGKARQVPTAVRVVRGILLFLGVSSLFAGVMMIFTIGPDDVLPSVWLDDIPLIDSWLVPGIVLAVGFGLGSILVYLGMRRRWSWPWAERISRYHWSWLGTVIIGPGHLVWIGLELVYLPDTSPLQVIYGAVGLALFTMPFLPTVQDYLRLDT